MKSTWSQTQGKQALFSENLEENVISHRYLLVEGQEAILRNKTWPDRLLLILFKAISPMKFSSRNSKPYIYGAWLSPSIDFTCWQLEILAAPGQYPDTSRAIMTEASTTHVQVDISTPFPLACVPWIFPFVAHGSFYLPAGRWLRGNHNISKYLTSKWQAVHQPSRNWTVISP